MPAYVWPGFTEKWEQILHARPDVLVINPASGLGADPNGGQPANYALWRDITLRAQVLGIRTIGYVPLNYGARDLDTAREECAGYKRWYPEMGGIFFDEAPPGIRQWGYLRGLHGYVRGSAKTGLSVFNAGTSGPKTKAAMLALPGSVWVTVETDAGTYLSTNPRPGFLAARQCHLVHHCGDLVPVVDAAFVACGVGWGFGAVGGWDQPL